MRKKVYYEVIFKHNVYISNVVTWHFLRIFTCRPTDYYNL